MKTILIGLAFGLASAEAQACRQYMQLNEDAFVSEVRHADIAFDGRLMDLRYWSPETSSFEPLEFCSASEEACQIRNYDAVQRADNVALAKFDVRQWFTEPLASEIELILDFSLDQGCTERARSIGMEYIVSITQIDSFEYPAANLHRRRDFRLPVGQTLEVQRNVLRDAGLY